MLAAWLGPRHVVGTEQPPQRSSHNAAGPAPHASPTRRASEGTPGQACDFGSPPLLLGPHPQDITQQPLPLPGHMQLSGTWAAQAGATIRASFSLV